jgi:hypothetical protein
VRLSPPLTAAAALLAAALAAPGAGGAPGVPGAPPGAALLNRIGAPGISRAMPSTMITSPGFRPASMTQRFSPLPEVQSPTVTGRGSATSLPSLSLPVT